MNRAIQALLRTVWLFAVIFVSGSSVLSGETSVSAEMGSPTGCKAPAATRLVRESVFLADSNVVSAFTPARYFEGCWTFWPSGPCRAIYNNNGSYEICGYCDDSGNPGSGRCSRISIQTLNHGYWCS